MTENDKNIQRMTELQAILKEASDAYYNKDIEIMSNYEYDALYDELVKLETETGIIFKDSITQGVGSEVVSALPKIEHKSPMLSLGKTKSRETLAYWLGEHEGCLSWKLDGSTVVLTYENGSLKQAVTRGNGRIGEDITAQARKFAQVPLNIEFNGSLVIRGEALMSYSEFERVNALQDEGGKYKNPRNLASGTMRALDLSVLDERRIDFYPFTLVSAEGYDSNSYTEQLDWLTTLGFTPVPHEKVTAEVIVDKISEYEEKVTTNDFPSDGLVLFFDDVAYGNSLGSTGHAPRNGIAFKWADETAATTLKEIFWSPSRTGRINPVAIFEPVELEGTTVERATLNNLTFIHDEFDVPYVGQKLEIFKANMVIPCVTNVDKVMPVNAVEIKIPDVCPVCGEKLVRQTDHDSEFLICPNEDCPAKMQGSLAHFGSRDALNIMGLSEKTIQRFMDAGIVKSFADLLNIKAKENEIVGKLEGIGQKSFDNLCAAVEDAKNTTAARFLYSLGIRECGRSASRDIVAAYGNNIEAIITAAENGDKESFTKVDGVGSIMADEIIKYLTHNAKMVRNLLSMVIITDAGAVKDTAGNNFVNGKTFVVTGAVNIFANRNELKAFVEDNGGKVSGSVSKNTDYLITNTPDSGSSKNKKAQECGTIIITEQEFCDKAGYQA